MRSSSARLALGGSSIRRRNQAVSAVVPRCSSVAARVEQLADVAEVGQPPLAVARRQHPRREALVERERLGQRRRDAAVRGGSACPAVQPRVDLLPVRARRRSRSARRSSRRTGSGPPSARPGGRGRPLDRLEQPQPVSGGRRAEHAAAAVDHRGDPHRLERVVDRSPPCGCADEDGDVTAARTGSPPHERADPRGSSGPGRRRRRPRRSSGAARALRSPVAGQPHRGAARRRTRIRSAGGSRRAGQPRRTGARARRAPGGRRSPRGRAGRRRTARRRRRSGPGRCAG